MCEVLTSLLVFIDIGTHITIKLITGLAVPFTDNGSVMWIII